MSDDAIFIKYCAITLAIGCISLAIGFSSYSYSQSKIGVEAVKQGLVQAPNGTWVKPADAGK